MVQGLDEEVEDEEGNFKYMACAKGGSGLGPYNKITILVQ